MRWKAARFSRFSEMQKATRLYTTIAVLFLNTLLCFVGLNLAVAGYGLLKENSLQQPTPVVPGSSPLEIYDYSLYVILDNLPAYRHVYYYLENEKDMLWLVLEHENRTQYCDKDTLFRSVPFKGRYLNIDPMGYRISSNNAPWPPDKSAYNIFVFGGSTTFGTGVADDHTIPFYMQQQIQAAYPTQKLYVYNFANPAFVSSQERMRFESLLRDGYVPDAAIFIDGLNDFYYLNLSNHGCLPDPYDTSQKWRNTFTCQPDEICLPLQEFAYGQLVEEEK
ncbi:MAG: SGNH/GDSL hydrolase family protein, partial [Anaerolineae bacterium]|nr:SGNH/GDSL hydrolase family protein [Anaerolineae bacterium]